MSPAPLAFDGVHKSLAGHPVLQGVTFACAPRSIVGLLGPNGAGKTTAVTLAAGLRAPDAGRVSVFGAEARAHAGRSSLSVVPQEIGFPDPVTVGHCIDFVQAQRRPSPLVPDRSVLLDTLGLGDLVDRRIGGLSGGQRRRLALVLGLVHAPGMLVLDEATSNLDEQSRQATWALIRQYADSGGSVLVTTHVLGDIDTHADRVVALAHGQVVVDDDIDVVRERLGGDRVQLDVPAERAGQLRDLVAAAGLGTAQPCADGRQIWRTRTALQLVRLIADAVPDATGLTVNPVPLAEMLAELQPDQPEQTQPEQSCPEPTP